MNNNIKYLLLIVGSVSAMTIIPYLIIKSVLSVNSSAPAFSILINGLVLPILLLVVVRLINESFKKDWWILNYPLIVGAILMSIYLGFLNWAEWAEMTPGGWGRDNVDKGTKMILNLQRMLGLGIVGIELLFRLVKKIRNRKTSS